MIWAVLVFLPLVLSLLIGVRTRAPWMTAVLCGGAAVPALAVAALGWGEGTTLVLPGTLLTVELGLDTTRRILLLLAALLWGAGGVAAAGYFKDDARVVQFRGFFLFAMAGNLGLIVAMDAASFYTFFALMTFASYGLVIHTRSPEALRAGRIYLIMAIFGELLLIAAVYAAVQTAGTPELAVLSQAVWASEWRHWIYGFAIAGFGVKVGIIPLYLWLPLAHPVAPAPASAILSGSMLKAGLLGWLHFAPLTQGGAPEWSAVLIVLGLSGAFGAVVIGLFQTDPKTNLAYSSISQMGLITAFFGLGHVADAPVEWILSAIAIYAWNHGMAKGALFLGAGLIPNTAGRVRWVLLVGLGLAVLILAGAPFTGGAAAKGALKDAGTYAPEAWVGVLAVLFVLSSLGTTLLLGRFLLLCHRKKAGRCAPDALGWQLAAWLGVLGLALLGAVVLFGQVLPELELKSGASGAFAAAWPVVLGAVLLIAWQWMRRGHAPATKPGIPPGDLVVLLERGAAKVRNWWLHRGEAALSFRVVDLERIIYRLLGVGDRGRIADRGEARLAAWSVTGVAFLGVLLLFIIVLNG